MPVPPRKPSWNRKFQLEPAAASLIFFMASSIVKLLGRWTAGNSLNVSANFAASAWTA
jgi:hypothetical protein